LTKAIYIKELQINVFILSVSGIGYWDHIVKAVTAVATPNLNNLLK